MDKVKVLLVGVGGYGANYIEEFTNRQIPDAEVVGIVDVMPDIETVYPVIGQRKIPVYRSVEDFYQEKQADLAVIATPIHLHYAQIRACLNSGSNVLTEKPVCTSVAGARELEQIAARTGHFVSVGYQLNYSRDVLTMKNDILNGKFGRPLYMKAMHAMRRGRIYYSRNNWAGRIQVHGCAVNDSPFNNACAHQFQNMTFVLGDTLETAAEIGTVTAELYRANPQTENFDTAAVKAVTEGGIPIWYYTSHTLAANKLGPVSEYHFEKGTIYFGRDDGTGPLNEYVAEMNDGSTYSYGNIQKGERLQKLYDAISCTKEGGQPVCTIQCAIPHLYTVNALAQMPVHPVRQEEVTFAELKGDYFCRIKNLEEIFQKCYQSRIMPSEADGGWLV